jgi:hypothetical protein
MKIGRQVIKSWFSFDGSAGKSVPAQVKIGRQAILGENILGVVEVLSEHAQRVRERLR